VDKREQREQIKRYGGGLSAAAFIFLFHYVILNKTFLKGALIMAGEKKPKKTLDEKLAEINADIAKQEEVMEKAKNKIKDLKLKKLDILEKMKKI